MENHRVAQDIVATRMKEKTAEEWAAIFDAHGWYAPIARFRRSTGSGLATGAIDTDTAGVALVNSLIQFSAGLDAAARAGAAARGALGTAAGARLSEEEASG